MTELLLSLLQIIIVNLVLSGDNAVVIALACRNLRPEVQKKAVFWGGFGAIGLRIILTFIAIWLLQIPFVQVLGGLLLIVIAVKLLKGEEEDARIGSGSNMMEALKTIIFADLIMSLDNVIAVAGAANGNMLLVVIGLAVSIPLIVWGSQLLMKLMNRFPIIVLLGAALLGYTAGEMIVGDKVVGAFLEQLLPALHVILPVALALVVIAVGTYLKRKGEKSEEGSAAQDHAETL
ncbi:MULTISPECIES: TerC family protein [Brevibacillus]|jgi:integral membrane protein, YjbE family|uniref:Membrane protein n=1 Tax=Brevibacillus parabrevis TaxID=54914 RepID=A0A4Y3P7W4_BREPA|nr:MULTISPECIES: TerC family protein [Brevibacillus]MDR5000239.1 TerC family protein [Brevibacillus parabrevis]MED2256775.1 TerC family protein [Brevibacillus parabrevis]NRQ52640.1 TerC family protein [Brevibacillus sp. HD1.4A]RNB96482.1 TerC family protein [Brevibacillus parabrevis]UED70202.1 TerC family protein [Brevibacillus sp. HD3.3A]